MYSIGFFFLGRDGVMGYIFCEWFVCISWSENLWEHLIVKL